jgi:hypothetical protein
MLLAAPSHPPWFDCLNIVCCRVQTSTSSCVAVHNMFGFVCVCGGEGVLALHQTLKKDIPLSPVHKFVLSTFCYHPSGAWGCAVPWCWSHLKWPLTVSHPIYHFAFIFCSFWDTFRLKCGRYSDHKEWFIWHIKKCFLMAVIGYKIGTFVLNL